MSYSSPTLAWLWGLQARWGGAHTSSPPPCATALALFGRSPDLCPGVLRSLVREARRGVHLRITPPPLVVALEPPTHGRQVCLPQLGS